MKRAEIIHQGNVIGIVSYDVVQIEYRDSIPEDTGKILFFDKDFKLTASFPASDYGFNKISEVKFLGIDENTEGRV